MSKVKGLNVLAVVPARSGSKGLPGKNIALCAGKPLICWTLEAAFSSKYISKVLVSTDSEEIGDVAKGCGAWVPFFRPLELSQDDSSIVDVVKDALNNVKEEFIPDYVVLLQPTSPVRSNSHIDEAMELFLSKKMTNSDTLVSVSEIESKNLWALGIDSVTGHLYSHFGLKLDNPRRQDLPGCYLPNGAIYIASANSFAGFYGENIIPYVMDSMSSLDVDYQEDLDAAAKLLAC